MKKLFTLFILLMFGLLAACGSSNSGNESGQANAEENDQENTTETESAIRDNLEFTAEAEQQQDGITFSFELVNHNEEDVTVTFPSGQQYEIVLKKDDEVVYQFSEGKMFTEALVEETIASGESKTWEEEWQPEQELAPGEYNVEMQLLPTKAGDEELEEGAFTSQFSIQISDMAEETSADGEELIRNIEVTGENGTYKVTGEMHPSIGNVYYEVEDGHNYLVEQTEIPIEGEDWYSFTIDISIAEEDLPFNGVIMMSIFNEDRSYVVPVQLDQIQ
ncbi:Intracellular proteinase inhibitor [Gracilibacillus ureilyticus]|uniref:Intracellular proteinase inhibitor n=1 Tax=Gracilibacillus ureilyticus TaxID=531814 RepID=A0A1H9SPT7_9BACI|nr:BsuPI-related putative proteinase inhibitor [Gracilibacillus ureilyticus]SER86423.1 Intracellular proteinase inhibitor [Gracilibacillus ureilyticus]